MTDATQETEQAAPQERVNYTEFGSGFDQVVLEESFVLNVKTTMSFVDFQVDFAVNDKYPLFTAPPEDSEHEYTYRRGRIFFPNIEQIFWESRQMEAVIDPGSGGVDYGSIDFLWLHEGRYHLAGYWGEMSLLCGTPILEIEELKQQYQQQQKKQQQQHKAQEDGASNPA